MIVELDNKGKSLFDMHFYIKFEKYQNSVMLLNLDFLENFGIPNSKLKILFIILEFSKKYPYIF